MYNSQRSAKIGRMMAMNPNQWELNVSISSKRKKYAKKFGYREGVMSIFDTTRRIELLTDLERIFKYYE